MRFYQNKTWLRRRYVTQGKTAAEIANECEVTEMTITRWLDEFGLIRNPRRLDGRRT